MKIAPIKNKKFGGVVTNVKLKNISEVECSEIKESFLELGFLLFPRQFLTDEENIHFGERFGTLEFGAQSFANQKKNKDGIYGEILGYNIQKMRNYSGTPIFG
jgi:alpha-ketoglutarate-dependent taurine dioxygenase